MELVKLMGGVVSLWQDTYLQACDADDDEKFGHSGLISAVFSERGGLSIGSNRILCNMSRGCCWVIGRGCRPFCT